MYSSACLGTKAKKSANLRKSIFLIGCFETDLAPKTETTFFHFLEAVKTILSRVTRCVCEKSAQNK
jgi:hypothetical protein